MKQGRRKTDNCIAKRLYEATTPYVQLIGWAGVAVPAIYVAFNFIRDSQAQGDTLHAHEASIRSLEERDAMQNQRLSNIDGKLDIIIDYMRKNTQ